MSDWFDGQLADSIAALDAGVSVNAEDRPHGAGEIGVLKTSAVSGGQFFPNQNKTVVESERRLVAEPVQGDSILVSRMNTPALVGESCYVTEAHPSLFLPDRIWQLKPKDRAKINMRWLSFVLQSATYRRHVEVHATGTSGSMKNLPKAKLLALPVSYPAPSEQARIAQVLDTLDTAIHETEAIIAKLKAVKQGLLHDLLTRGLAANGEMRPPQAEAPHLYKQSPLGWIPSDWKTGPFGIIAQKIQDGTHFSPTLGGEDYLYVTSRNIRFGYMDLTEVDRIDKRQHNAIYQRCDPRCGDLLITKDGANTGNAALNICEEEISLLSSVAFLRFDSSADAAGFFLHYVLSPTGQQRIKDQMSGNAITRLTLAKIRGFLVPRPPRTEQLAILATLDQADSRLSTERDCWTNLRAAKSALMDDLLTGRVRVTPLLTAEHPQKSA